MIARDNSECKDAEKIIQAQNAGAIGAVVYQDFEEGLIDMEGIRYPDIPSTMIHYQAGIDLKEAYFKYGDIPVSFWNEIVSGFWFAIDSKSELQEMGFIMYPSFEFIAYIGQYLYFQQELSTSLQNHPGDITNIVLFNQVSCL